MIITLPYAPLFILGSSFILKDDTSCQNLQNVNLLPGKIPGSVRLFALTGHQLLEFCVEGVLEEGMTFEPFSLNLKDVVKNVKLKGKKDTFTKVDISLSEENPDVEILTSNGIVFNLKKEEVKTDVNALWERIKKESAEEHQNQNLFSVPEKGYASFFFKNFPESFPVFTKHGNMTLVSYPKSEGFPYMVKGICMQVLLNEALLEKYDLEPFPSWI